MRIPDATERNVLLYCGSTATVICLLPGDIISALLAAALTGGFYMIHMRLLQREEAEATRAAAAEPKDPAPSSDPSGADSER